MINAGIVGGTGYTGVELLRILVQHPKVKLKVITSRQEAGTGVDELFPVYAGRLRSSSVIRRKWISASVMSFLQLPMGLPCSRQKLYSIQE